MATLNLYYRWEIPLDGKYINGGSTSLPVTVSVTNGYKHDATYSVAGAAKKVLLNVGSTSTDDIASFAFCVITSTQNGWIEVTGTAAADNSNIPITANVPCIIGYSANGTKAYNAAGDFAGASQNITKINFLNAAAATASTVRIVAFA